MAVGVFPLCMTCCLGVAHAHSWENVMYDGACTAATGEAEVQELCHRTNVVASYVSAKVGLIRHSC